MAGIKLLDKKPAYVNLIVNELMKPEVKKFMFDDMIGFTEVSLFLLDPFTLVYGIFEKGHPVPIGTIILSGLRPFRGCEIHATIFKPENRNASKLQGVARSLREDLMSRWNLHYAEARALSTNAPARHILEKLGMSKVGTKPGNIVVDGKYCDVDEYYIVLDGDKMFEPPLMDKEA